MYPFIHIWGRQLPSYGLMIVLGLLVSGFWGARRLKRAGQRWEDGIVIGACGFGCALLGAVLLYMLVTFGPAKIFSMIADGSIWTEPVFGMVFYGGLIGAVPGVLLGLRLTKAPINVFTPLLLPCLPLGHAFGRVGCFLGGCCYGRPTSLPIGVVYPDNAISGVPTGVPLLPTQLMEVVALLVITFILAYAAKRKASATMMVGLYASLYATWRFTLEFFRYDAIRGAWAGLSTSQWISLGLAVLGLACLLCTVFQRRQQTV